MIQRKELKFSSKKKCSQSLRCTGCLVQVTGCYYFLSFSFFPRIFLGVLKVLLGSYLCPPQGHCALTARGEAGLRFHCSTLI